MRRRTRAMPMEMALLSRDTSFHLVLNIRILSGWIYSVCVDTGRIERACLHLYFQIRFPAVFLLARARSI